MAMGNNQPNVIDPSGGISGAIDDCWTGLGTSGGEYNALGMIGSGFALGASVMNASSENFVNAAGGIDGVVKGNVNSINTGNGDPPEKSKIKWENSDGYITVEEAVNTWKYGGGKQHLEADLDKLDLSKVHVSDFKKGVGSRIVINFAGEDYTNPTQAVVYGNVTLELMEGNKVFAPFQDKYDFNIQRYTLKSLRRNILTMFGNMFNSFGTPYYITLNGTATIKP